MNIVEGKHYYTENGYIVGPMRKVWINAFRAEGDNVKAWNSEGNPANSATTEKLSGLWVYDPQAYHVGLVDESA